MEFVLGIILGFLIAILVIAMMMYFRMQVEQVSDIIENRVETIRPKLRGGIHLPEDEGTIARKEIIKKNREAGKDTPISELK